MKGNKLYRVVQVRSKHFPVMNFRSKDNQTAMARAHREFKLLGLDNLELEVHVGPAGWQIVGALKPKETA